MFVEERAKEREEEENAEQWERCSVCPVSFCTSHPIIYNNSNNYNKQARSLAG